MNPGGLAATRPIPSMPRVKWRSTIDFEYVGEKALTVVGPVSGAYYRFAAPHARVAIDVRDKPSLARIPQLREVR